MIQGHPGLRCQDSICSFEETRAVLEDLEEKSAEAICLPVLSKVDISEPSPEPLLRSTRTGGPKQVTFPCTTNFSHRHHAWPPVQRDLS